jgi:phosphoribosyl-ATP pyrophosphohydrolase/phosphoribosyl-AMP cyclohydrolase/histidinol dehydrogenase
MGGTKPTFTPYPTFHRLSPASSGHLSALGRCQVDPMTCTENADEFQAILLKAIAQSEVDDGVSDPDQNSANKKLKKKYMKQSVAMAQSYLSETLNVDASIINVEIVLESSMIIDSDGCLASCFLDAGCDKVVLKSQGYPDMLKALEITRLPKERLMVQFDLVYVNQLIESTPNVISNIASFTNSISVGGIKDLDLESSTTLISHLGNAVEPSLNSTDLMVVLQVPSIDNVGSFVSSISKFCQQDTTPKGTVSIVDTTSQILGMAFAECIRTDRPDSLYTTVVCTRSGEALGLVYSSKESIVAALECGRGVYYSRSRNGLWRKGDTSGRFQTLHRIDVDCDGDALRFSVTQRGEDYAAFCHLHTLTCWGEGCGIRHLEGVLKDRINDAPEGSYTKRLFDDAELLRDKLVEEAQELSEAEDKEDVAGELADVLYFAMVKAAKAGVSIDDAVAVLDKRARKVTRRKGDSKAFRISAGDAILTK